VKITHQVVFDAADLAATSSFWAGVFSGTIDCYLSASPMHVSNSPAMRLCL
jgi:hypothetical protein